MKTANSFLFPLLLALFVACAPSYRIFSDYERDADFSAYKTFQIIKHKDGFKVGTNPINRQRIERAIIREMKELGYQPKENPDLLVSYFVKTTTLRDNYSIYYGWWGFPAFWVDVHQYKEGSLVIDFIDAGSKQVVWHGVTSSRVYTEMPDAEERINKIVKTMFRRYAEETGQTKAVASASGTSAN